MTAYAQDTRTHPGPSRCPWAGFWCAGEQRHAAIMSRPAHGHSLTGERAECDRILDGAARLAAQVDDEHVWGNACHRTPGWFEVQRATCYARRPNAAPRRPGLREPSGEPLSHAGSPAPGVRACLNEP
jgi:hypothetical protein